MLRRACVILHASSRACPVLSSHTTPDPQSLVPVGRFAPTPSGPLHFGSLVAALGSWLRARSLGARWQLRIDDIDRPREQPGAAEDILATLAAFGLRHDGPVVYQSRRGAAHAAALAALQVRGAIYPCACTRSDLAPFGGVHPDRCLRTRADATPGAWRVRVPYRSLGFLDVLLGPRRQVLGDFVVQRADGTVSYQLATVVDDADAGVTEVVRGADLLESTARQILLQRLLGLPRPGYLHLPLVLDRHGRKLGKSAHAPAIDARDPVPALRAALSFLGQPVPRATSVRGLLAAAIAGFDVERIRARPPGHDFPHRRGALPWANPPGRL
jgi:glutamyl-Q tRNA(Asp) synthetase